MADENIKKAEELKEKKEKERAIRYEEGKISEIFTLVLRGTQEVNWFNNSNTSRVITINEEQLEKVLNGESIETRQRENIVNTKFRF